MSPTHHTATIDARLRNELEPVARRIRRRQWHRSAAVTWIFAAAVALVASIVASLLSLTLVAGFALSAFLAGACILFLLRSWRRENLDYRAAAIAIERYHPTLRQVLLTAIEQRPDSTEGFGFLQRQVISEALRHSFLQNWSDTPVGRPAVPVALHLAALAAFVGASLISFNLPMPESGAIFVQAVPSVEILPGDIEVQRGSPVVISARFTGTIPNSVWLHWKNTRGDEQSVAMNRSLSDPVFAHTILSVTRDTQYAVRFQNGESSEHRISVFDLPALVQADATIDHPEYTGLGTKVIADTRRVSAVEGSSVSFEFTLNKPVAGAALEEREGNRVELRPIDDNRTRYSVTMDLDTSRRYSLHLEDDDGRENVRPPEIRLEALINKTPDLRLTAPRGDVKVSAIEEVMLQSEARDDFGLLDWGLGYAVGPTPPIQISLKNSQGIPLETTFEYLLALEQYKLEQGDLVAWYLWAQDIGPDEQPRTTTSDMYFGEVRPFDEIFRESEGGGPQQGQGSSLSEGEELLQIQRQISIAIWKMRQEPNPGSGFQDDIDAIREAQDSARQMLEAQREQIQQDEARELADEAARYMDQTGRKLAETRRAHPSDTLPDAWQSSQGAYQALLKMMPDENRVSRARNSGQGGASRNQRQLDRLRFRDEDDPYENESQAQAMTSPEEREQIQTISRLRELARRQQDMNQRLQELQTALQAAETEAERDRIRHELKRLEEEQRRMLADLDEVRERLDQRRENSSARQASQQLDQTRQDMQNTSEALQQESVSEALASGTRARERLEETRDELRRNSSSQFAEDMRNLRRQARELAQDQAETGEEIESMDSEGFRSLSDDDEREQLARDLEERRVGVRALLEEMQRITEAAEDAEPGLYRRLYDTLREHGQGGAEEIMETAADLLRRGFLQDSRELQSDIAQELEILQREIDEAAEYVLGDETSTLRFAQQELEDLASDLGNDRRESPDSQAEDNTPGQDGAADSPADQLRRALEEMAQSESQQGSGQGGPLTGGGYAEWSERLRTVESLLESDEARARISGARQMADSLRGEYRRHGEPPKWEIIESEVADPLRDVGGWLKQEIARIEDPTSLNPADRDPVPEKFAEAVEKYYESLSL